MQCVFRWVSAELHATIRVRKNHDQLKHVPKQMFRTNPVASIVAIRPNYIGTRCDNEAFTLHILALANTSYVSFAENACVCGRYALYSASRLTLHP